MLVHLQEATLTSAVAFYLAERERTVQLLKSDKKTRLALPAQKLLPPPALQHMCCGLARWQTP